MSSCFPDCLIPYLVLANAILPNGTSFLLGSTLCPLHDYVLIKRSKQFFEQSQFLGISTYDIFFFKQLCTKCALLSLISPSNLSFVGSLNLKTVYTFLPCYEVGIQAAWSPSLLLAHSHSPIPFLHFPYRLPKRQHLQFNW